MLSKLSGVLFLILLAPAIVLSANFKQADSYIILQKPNIKISPKEFYVNGFIDNREDKSTIGSLQVTVNSSPLKNKVRIVNLKDGFNAIENFVNAGVAINKSLRPIILKLNTFSVTEEPLNAGLVKGIIRLSITYYLQKEGEQIYLTDYNTNTTYQRSTGVAQQIEPLLRNALSSSLDYFNNWMNSEVSANIKLAKNVKLIFTEYSEDKEGDTIYYNINRPLKWTDFKGKKTIGSKNSAEIFAGLGYDESTTVANSTIYVSLVLKVYTPKSACWVTPGVSNSYALNHEQRHFDIARLAAEYFKKLLLAESINTDNYDGIINVAYLDALREMNDQQKKYDFETIHSTNTYQQQRWNAKIDKEMIDFGIKKKGF